MKKLASKIRARKQPKQPVGRITNDTLAEHREQVLAGGRKFKYPVQYARHKLVINAAIIAGSAIVLLIALGWYLLYPAQNTSEFIYRVTRVVPVSVAKVDGERVRYSDYLMKYRSAVHYLVEKERIDIKTEDGKRQLDFIKSSSMDDAVADAYAQKLARENDVSVDAAEVEVALKQARQSEDEEISEAAQAGVLADYYGWSMSEYRGVVAQKLLRQKVSYKIDDKARGTGATIERMAKDGDSFKEITEALNKDAEGTVTHSPATWLPRTNQDNGITAAAARLNKGEVSSAITTPGDGYYYIKLLDKNDTEVRYEFIYVPLTAFSAQLEKIKEDDKVSHHIKLEPVSPAGEGGN